MTAGLSSYNKKTSARQIGEVIISKFFRWIWTLRQKCVTCLNTSCSSGRETTEASSQHLASYQQAQDRDVSDSSPPRSRLLRSWTAPVGGSRRHKLHSAVGRWGHSARTVLEVAGGKQLPGPTWGQFSGRVLWDRDVLSLGQIHITLTQITYKDQGLYWCYMYANYHPPSSSWKRVHNEYFNLTVKRNKQTETKAGHVKYPVSELSLFQTSVLCAMFTYMILTVVIIVFVRLHD
ncbi:hypothetical protein WMY93_014676 [Mugilogobius chulae]|uniref:Immunoglobulin V-set domain-containing protein n=1 Tax=Mugilogobius chulae TaxID=88201 RepID=A0AAW0NVL4_9GOBI